MLRPLALVLAACALATAAQAQPSAPSLLAPVFQDHAVLQRDRPVPVWGEAAPNAEVTLSFAGHDVTTRADRSGHWRTTLPATGAGGPYTLDAHAGAASQHVADILVGDVYLCSGQSNMEFQVSHALEFDTEISNSANDQIRFTVVPHATSAAPVTTLPAPLSWHAAAPDTTGWFSAACYFFAREMQKTVHAPFGLIQSTWSGSRIEPWISAQTLHGLGGYDERLALLRTYAHDQNAGMRAFGEQWEAWWRTHAHDSPWLPTDNAGWQPAPDQMRDWKRWGVPALANYNGMVWFRRDVTLTAAQAAQAATLSLGGLDEEDEAWINGKLVGAMFGWGDRRTYSVPRGVLHAGTNTIVVNVYSSWDAGGMLGPASEVALHFEHGDATPLAGQWRYKMAPTNIGLQPRTPWESIGGLTSIGNAMIAPLGPYALRGVLWYQGESNAGEPATYQRLLASMMSDWRRQLGADTPFLIVQLPNFGSLYSTPGDSGWAGLREAERRAVAADPHAGLAVTIDLGIADELHPPNKQGVARRLARAARHVVYGEDVSPSGPQVRNVARDGANIIVNFTGIDGALVTYNSNYPIAFELCTATACHFADAHIVEGDYVVLSGPDAASATRVRYCWGDAPVCNLYDRDGLPAGPFEAVIQ